MNLELGQRVIAKRECGSVAAKGERGVVYEEYTIGQTSGVSILFEKGGYDGFSERDQEMCLEPLEEECQFARTYHFQSVGQVMTDYRKGCFTFSPEGAALRQEVRALLIRGA